MRRYLPATIAAMLVAAGLAWGQALKGTDVKPRGHRSEPVRVTFPISGTVGANQKFPQQCVDNILFPANFVGLFPDANASANCLTPSTSMDTFPFKVAGSQIGSLALGSSTITLVNWWQSAGPGNASSMSVNTSGAGATGNPMLANDVCILASDFFTTSNAQSTGGCGSFICGGANGTWTLTGGGVLNVAAINASEFVYYRVMTAGDIGGTFSTTYTNTAYSLPGIACFRGVSTSTPIDVASNPGQTGTTSTSITATGITTTNGNDAIFWHTIWGSTTAITASVPSGPPAFSALWNSAYNGTTTFGNTAGYLISGYTANATVSGTLSSGEQGWGTILVALLPASAGTNVFSTTNGQPQSCAVGQTIELDAPGVVHGEGNCAVTLGGHVP